MTGTPTTPALPGSSLSPGAKRARQLVVITKMLLPTVALGVAFCAIQSAAAHAAREQSERSAWAILWIGMGLLTAITSAGVALSFRRKLGDQRRRRARSIEASGEVVSILAKGVTGSVGYTETPVVRFSTQGGEARELLAALPNSKVAVGEKVPVRYDPEDAGWAIVPGGDADAAGRWLRRAFIGVMALSAGMIVFGIYKGLTDSALTTVAQRAGEHEPPHRGSPNYPNWLYSAIGVGCVGWGLWMLASTRRDFVRWRERRQRSREVQATVQAVAGGGARTEPTFKYRTFEGETIASRSAVVIESKKAGAPFTVGAGTRVLYDPQEPTWVIPADYSARRRWINGTEFGLISLSIGALALALPLLPGS